MSYQKKLPYFNELKQMANDIAYGKLNYEKDTLWNKPHISKEQRKKISKVSEWWWMKYEGIGPQINPSGEIAPTGKCKATYPYKSKDCYLYDDNLHMNEVGYAHGEYLCSPMCYPCFSKWQEDHDDF